MVQQYNLELSSEQYLILSQFRWRALCGMIIFEAQRKPMRERDHAVSFKGTPVPPNVLLMGIRWYVA